MEDSKLIKTTSNRNIMTRLGLTTLLGLSIASWNQTVLAASVTDTVSAAEAKTIPASEDQILHTDLIMLALKADFFNRRCRGISVNKDFNKVNRLFITKYSLTANNYIKTYINPDVRAEKQLQELEFKKELNKIGGCAKAREQGWRKQITDLFNELYRQAEQSTWYPEE